MQIQAPLPAHTDVFGMFSLLTVPLVLVLRKLRLRAVMMTRQIGPAEERAEAGALPLYGLCPAVPAPA
jgi:hypothetical protein